MVRRSKKHRIVNLRSKYVGGIKIKCPLMYYVYILQSISEPNQIYVGCTENLEKRLKEHNLGKATHTDKNKPWKIIVFIAFEQKKKAYEFEEYLKSGSGRAFRDRRLI